jgi:hypothetical protein
MRVAAVITHAAHVPERAGPLSRLLAQLPESADKKVTVYSEPGKPHEWSLGQWKLGLAQDADYLLFLNDDMVACDDVWAVLDRVLEARPEHIINFYNTTDMAITAQEKGYNWVTTPDGLIGNAYLFPKGALEDFVGWRESLPETTYTALSEDQLINLWCMQHGYLVWHTVPALFDHDTSIASVYGNTQLRRPTVPPRADMPTDWNTDGLHAGRMFTGNHWYLIRKLPWEWVVRDRLIDRAYELEADKVTVGR